MIIKFSEIYYENRDSNFLLAIIKDKEEEIFFNDFKYIKKIDDSYIIDFSHGCIDLLNSNNLITEIFKFSNGNFIDKSTFNKYLINKQKEELDKYGKTEVIGKPIPNKCSIGTNLNYRNHSYTFFQNEMVEEIYKSSEYPGYNDNKEIITFTQSFHNEMEYINSLLNIVFNSNFHFVLKKCEKCQKYFFAKTKNTKNCTRIYKDNITCNKYAEKVRKRNQFKDPIKHLIKNVNDKLKNDNMKSENFKTLLTVKKEEFLYDDKGLVLWILYTYYTENGRKNIIERLKLQPFID